MIRAVGLAVLAALGALALVGSAGAAAPRIILVSGPGLCRPVILDDWFENLSLVTSIDRQGEVVDVTGRPYLDLALFWGPDWDRYIQEGRPLDALRMEQATELWRFYPAFQDAPPAVVFGTTIDETYGHPISPEGVGVLARYGVSTYLASEAAAIADCPSSVPWPGIAGGAAAGATLLLFAGATLVLRMKRAHG